MKRVLLLSVIQINDFYAMKELPKHFNQESIINFDSGQHLHLKTGLHYGFMYGFEVGVSHKNFPPCSVQEGLKKAQNVYVDDENKTLVITKDCTHWIDIDGTNLEKNKEQLNALIVAINSLNKDIKGIQAPRFDTIKICINLADKWIHRYSTSLFGLYLAGDFFGQLKHIKRIYYIPDGDITINPTPCRLFIYQNIIEHQRKKYYFPLVLIEPEQKYTVLVNGVIDKRIRQDKNTYDIILFADANKKSTIEEYTVMVHPNIQLEEVVQENAKCANNIDIMINHPPSPNRIQEYPLWLLEKISHRYGIHIGLLVTPDQHEKLDFYSRTTTEVAISDISLEECLKKKYGIFVNKNTLVIENSAIDRIQWISTKEEKNIEQLKNSLVEKLYFLCWLKGINKIQIHVPESYPNNVSSQEINPHSLSVVSRLSLNILKGVSTVVRDIEYVPYDFYQNGPINNRILYIHNDVEEKVPLKKNKDEKYSHAILEHYLISIAFVVAKNVEMKLFSDAALEKSKNSLPERQDNNTVRQKNNYSVLNWFVTGACLSILACIVSERIAHVFFNKRLFGMFEDVLMRILLYKV
ncbi:MAG TPA: hypothetical protein VL201_02895 [Patescibacteria group bacterium]|nr:hypothetical protein [Patescibacteria group bacterium]